MDTALKGMIIGFIGVAMFGLTLPVTHVALPYMDPMFIAMGRASVASILALVMLLATRSRMPTRSELWQIAIFAGGTVFGFPLCSTIAMETVPASHGGVVLGLLPLITAVVGSIITHEKPSIWFWLAGVLGSVLVILFALIDGEVGFAEGDWWLLLAAITVSIAYAYGGRLSQTLGGWQVISWALVFSAPITFLLAWESMPSQDVAIPVSGWMAFLYLGLFSQFIGFFFWNRGLAIGGIARVSQIQLLQPFVTLIAAALMIGELIDLQTMGFAIAIVAVVALGKRAPIKGAQD